MSLSEQAVSFMAAAAAGNGPSALDRPPDTPEMLGRSLLRMVPGEAAPLTDFLASPAAPAPASGTHMRPRGRVPAWRLSSP
jgi:hypothetical protein